MSEELPSREALARMVDQRTMVLRLMTAERDRDRETIAARDAEIGRLRVVVYAAREAHGNHPETFALGRALAALDAKGGE